jgi:hypothetical protein
MYCTKFAIYKNDRFPRFNSILYHEIAEIYGFPEIESIVRSLNGEPILPAFGETGIELYELRDLIEGEKEKHLFELRFPYSEQSRDKAALFFSVQRDTVLNLTFDFPGKSGRIAFTYIIGALKLVAKHFSLRSEDIPVEIAGFPEQGLSKPIKEHSISAFYYCTDYGINRYLYAREDARKIDDVRRGRRG